MSRLLSYLTILALTAPLAGCLVATRPGRTTVVERCGPGEHWDDGRCRHNGRGHDRDDDDHDHGHGHGRGHDRD